MVKFEIMVCGFRITRILQFDLNIYFFNGAGKKKTTSTRIFWNQNCMVGMIIVFPNMINHIIFPTRLYIFDDQKQIRFPTWSATVFNFVRRCCSTGIYSLLMFVILVRSHLQSNCLARSIYFFFHGRYFIPFAKNNQPGSTGQCSLLCEISFQSSSNEQGKTTLVGCLILGIILPVIWGL